MYPYIYLFIAISRDEKLKGRIHFQTRSNDRPIDRSGRIRSSPIQSTDGFTNVAIEGLRGARLAAQLPRGSAARVGIGRHGRAAAGAARFVVVVFTPRCLKPSSRVSFRSGLERLCTRTCTFAVISRRETKTKSGNEIRSDDTGEAKWRVASRGEEIARSSAARSSSVAPRSILTTTFLVSRFAPSACDPSCGSTVIGARAIFARRGTSPVALTSLAVGDDARQRVRVCDDEWRVPGAVCCTRMSASAPSGNERECAASGEQRGVTLGETETVHQRARRAENTCGSWDRGMHADR